MDYIVILLFGIFMEMSFLLGIKISDKRGNTIVSSKPSIKKPKLTKEEIEELDKLQEIERINLANIESYDGTETGQEEFPR